MSDSDGGIAWVAWRHRLVRKKGAAAPVVNSKRETGKGGCRLGERGITGTPEFSLQGGGVLRIGV